MLHPNARPRPPTRSHLRRWLDACTAAAPRYRSRFRSSRPDVISATFASCSRSRSSNCARTTVRISGTGPCEPPSRNIASAVLIRPCSRSTSAFVAAGASSARMNASRFASSAGISARSRSRCAKPQTSLRAQATACSCRSPVQQPAAPEQPSSHAPPRKRRLVLPPLTRLRLVRLKCRAMRGSPRQLLRLQAQAFKRNHRRSSRPVRRTPALKFHCCTPETRCRSLRSNRATFRGLKMPIDPQSSEFAAKLANKPASRNFAARRICVPGSDK